MDTALLDDEEAERIAGELAGRYGHDAFDHVRMRAEQALSVGDDLAHSAWQAIGAALESMMSVKLLAD